MELPCPSSSSLCHEESQNNDDTEVPTPIEDTNSTVAGNNIQYSIEVAGHVKDTNNPAAIFDYYCKS